MAAYIDDIWAAGKGMNQPRYIISKVKRTIARPVIVRLAFVLLVAVAGSEQAFATIDNAATATGIYAGQPVTSNTDSVQITVTPAGPALLVTKTATPDTNVSAGTVVTYTYVVRNSGTQVLTDISLNDVHSGSGLPPVPANETLTTDVGNPNDSTDSTANDGLWSVLAPGDEITLTATYTITQSDVDTQQ